uniref:Uncharacterized protein n=1 Tax=Ditylenchus dipsaci TaxID=166011 RepID=A0A915D2Q3_9BILA
MGERPSAFLSQSDTCGVYPEQEARAAVAAGFLIYSVSVVDTSPQGVPVNQMMLDAIVKTPKDSFTMQNFDQLTNLVRQKNLKCLT